MRTFKAQQELVSISSRPISLSSFIIRRKKERIIVAAAGVEEDEDERQTENLELLSYQLN